MTEKNEPTGSLTLQARRYLALDQVVDVLAFDENAVTLSTSLGLLAIEGEELHVKKMDMASGECVLEGKINSLFYMDDRASHKKGLFGRRK